LFYSNIIFLFFFFFYLLRFGLVDLLLNLLDLLLDKLLKLLEKIVDRLLMISIETEPDEAEEDSSIEHAADTHVTSKIDDEEEAKDHANRERNRADENSVDTDSKECLNDITNKLEETIDVFSREFKVLISKLTLALLTLEVSNDIHDIEAKGSKKKEEEDPANKTKNSELVAKKNDEENVDNTENKKRLHEILPHEDLLGLSEEFALLKRLADHVTRTSTRARRRLLGLLLRCRFFSLGFFNRCRFLNRSCGLFVRHYY